MSEIGYPPGTDDICIWPLIVLYGSNRMTKTMWAPMQFFLYHLDTRKHQQQVDENKEHVRLELRPISVVSLNQIIWIGGGGTISKIGQSKAFHARIKIIQSIWEFTEASQDYMYFTTCCARSFAIKIIKQCCILPSHTMNLPYFFYPVKLGNLQGKDWALLL